MGQGMCHHAQWDGGTVATPGSSNAREPTERGSAAAASAASELAVFLRENIDEVARAYRERYAIDCTYSTTPRRLGEQASLAWSASVVRQVADALEFGGPALRVGQARVGDIVIQGDETFRPYATLFETLLFTGRALASVITTHFLGEPASAAAMLAALEECLQRSISQGIDDFRAEVCAPGAMTKVWSGMPVLPVKPANAGADGAGEAGSLETLTRRERQVALLVLEGRANAQIASELGLQLSTVKNNLGRVFDKLGVSNRTELVIALKGREGAGNLGLR